MFYDIITSAFRPLIIAADDSGIHSLDFAPAHDPSFSRHMDRFHDPSPAAEFNDIPEGWTRNPSFLKSAVSQILSYLKGDLKTFTLELNPKGTEFQKSVWKALLNIPYGKTVSYQDIAIAVGKSSATRAVGLACGKNPIPIIIPCHRVIGKNGKLTGYSGGLDIKTRLLQLEGVI